MSIRLSSGDGQLRKKSQDFCLNTYHIIKSVTESDKIVEKWAGLSNRK